MIAITIDLIWNQLVSNCRQGCEQKVQIKDDSDENLGECVGARTCEELFGGMESDRVN